jgi:uncharacterized membrane protein
MFPLLIPALVAITVSSLIMRMVIGYLVRPPGAPRTLWRVPSVNPRWLGRQLAVLIYGRKKKK